MAAFVIVSQGCQIPYMQELNISRESEVLETLMEFLIATHFFWALLLPKRNLNKTENIPYENDRLQPDKQALWTLS